MKRLQERTEAKRKQMNLVDVIIHFRIEEKTERTKELTFKANLFDNNLSRPKKYFYKPNFKSNQNPKMKRNPNSTFKKKGNCFVCGKPGHYSAQCSFQKTGEALSKQSASLIQSDIIVFVISEVNIATYNKKWVIDSGATRYICADKGAISS